MTFFGPDDEFEKTASARKMAASLGSLAARGAKNVGKSVWTGAKTVAGKGPAPNLLGKELSKNVGAAGIIGSGALAATQVPIAAKSVARKAQKANEPLKAHRDYQKRIFL